MATIIQTVSTSLTTATTFALPSGVWTDIPGVSCNITPLHPADSILFNAVVIMEVATGNFNPVLTRIVANGNPVNSGIASGGEVSAYSRAILQTGFNHSCNYMSYLTVDTTGYLALVTYKIQLYGIGANTIYLNSNPSASFVGCTTIVIDEIG